jgi:hypothetical protein
LVKGARVAVVFRLGPLCASEMGADLHQLLTYCALNFATKALDIKSVGLVNPRVGTFIFLDLDYLCMECAGSSAADVLDEILQYVSEPLGAYGR